MSVSIELLDALKAFNGGCSDYKAAQLIGVRQQTMSQYRSERCPLSAEKVLLICEMIGFDAVDWLLRYHRERAKCDKEKAVFDSVLARLAA